jgi:ssDNA-binding Zn-finger/Zn-ribbon topoisomerase 1
MARINPRERAERQRTLMPLRSKCPACGGFMRIRYGNYRTLVMLDGAVRLTLKIRRCEEASCSRFRQPYRPESEGALALPHHEFGLDVLALVGALRYVEHRSVVEIHAALLGRGLPVCQRSVTNMLYRYDELLATALSDSSRLRSCCARPSSRSGCRSRASSAMGRPRSAGPWRGRFPGCRTSCASFTSCARRPRACSRPTGTRRRSSTRLQQ